MMNGIDSLRSAIALAAALHIVHPAEMSQELDENMTTEIVLGSPGIRSRVIQGMDTTNRAA
jgi:LPS O-antigen subunit length determinant protein (WzzB/FepE family)